MCGNELLQNDLKDTGCEIKRLTRKQVVSHEEHEPGAIEFLRAFPAQVKAESRKPKPETRNPKPEARSLKPEA